MRNLTSKPIPLELKRASADNGTFVGLASSWGIDSFGDRITPGAFATTLQEWAQRGGNIPLLFQHDQFEPIGSITSAQETAEGLEVAAQIAIDTPTGAVAYSLLQKGALSMSIGFVVPDDGSSFDDMGVRVLTAIDLCEISLVSMPANRDATVRSVKRYASRAELEGAARSQLNLSARQAKSLAAAAWPALGRATEEDDELEAAASRFECLLSKIS